MQRSHNALGVLLGCEELPKLRGAFRIAGKDGFEVCVAALDGFDAVGQSGRQPIG